MQITLFNFKNEKTNKQTNKQTKTTTTTTTKRNKTKQNKKTKTNKNKQKQKQKQKKTTYCHCSNTFKNFNNHIYLTLKIEKQEINYLITVMHCGIVLNFTLPKSALSYRIRQCCLIGQSARTDKCFNIVLLWWVIQKVHLMNKNKKNSSFLSSSSCLNFNSLGLISLNLVLICVV